MNTEEDANEHESQSGSPGTSPGSPAGDNADLAAASREAAISSHRDQPVGVCIVLTAAELAALDIEPGEVNSIRYEVEPEGNCVSISETNEDSQNLSDTRT